MANGNIWNPNTRMYEAIDDRRADNLPISGVTPRFCFICGSGLKDAGHDWLQCESEECAEMFRTHKDAKGNQHVMMFRTPFTPK